MSVAGTLTREGAREALRRLAATVREPDEGQAVARLLERLAGQEPELKAALLEVGARAVLRGELGPP
jgi:hypothetical protein